MKTIEEASGDYTHKNYGKRKVDAYIHEAFKSGVEFAQRWYDMKELKPLSIPLLFNTGIITLVEHLK